MKRECVGIQYVDSNLMKKPDYEPKDFKEAKKQIIAECKGKTNISQILGLRFRLTGWSIDDQLKWDKFVTNICNDELKKYNGIKPKGFYERLLRR